MSERILQYLPEYYRVIQDFAVLDRTETIELNFLQDAVDQLFSDQFVLTSGLPSIRRREQMLGIQADPTTESLDFRRRRILNRYQTKPPFTVRYLQQQLDMIVGRGMTIVEVDPQAFLLTVTASIDNASLFREVLHTIQTVKPANMEYQQHTALRLDIGLEEHILVKEIIWNYRLDSLWQLGERPFVSYGPEVTIT